MSTFTIDKYSRLHTDTENTWVSTALSSHVSATFHRGSRLIVQSTVTGTLENLSLTRPDISSKKVSCLSRDLVFGVKYVHNSFDRKFQLKFKTREECVKFKEMMSEYVDSKGDVKSDVGSKHDLAVKGESVLSKSTQTEVKCFAQISNEELRERVVKMLADPESRKSIARLEEIIDGLNE